MKTHSLLVQVVGFSMVLGALVVGCSGAPDGSGERAASSEEALCTEAPCSGSSGGSGGSGGYSPPTLDDTTSSVCTSIQKQTGQTCGVLAGMNLCFPTYTTYVPNDTCGATSVPLPPRLVGRGCTPYGMVVNGANVWACPASLSLIQVAGVNGLYYCAAGYIDQPFSVAYGDPNMCSNCIGAPDAGWQLIIDAGCQSMTAPVIGGGCKGPCST